MNRSPLRAFCDAHPALVCHLLVFAFAPVLHRALTAIAGMLLAGRPHIFAALQPLIAYLPVPVYLYLFIRSVNTALALPCRENARLPLFVYRIVLIVLLLSMLSFLVITVMGALLMPLLPTL